MNDEEIITLYWKRDEKAIAVTAERYGSYCHSISYNILHNTEDEIGRASCRERV